MQDLNKDIKVTENSIDKDLQDTATLKDLESVRVKYLGRKGILINLMSQLKKLDTENKRTFGPLLNKLKLEITNKINIKKEAIEHDLYLKDLDKDKHFDVTAHSTAFKNLGSLHPYTHIINKLENIFITMGYKIINGPEIENEYYNFTALNIPEDHPARDMQDTFWLTLPNMLMRTHTSSVQIHALENSTLPLAIATIGRTYRNEATDASHDFMFWQTEILYINKSVSISNLLATIHNFLTNLFDNKNLNIRTRPSYFPFTEPSIEVDIECPFCTEGCSICKNTRWIELGGAGLVHPNVLKSAGIDNKIYSGFAFGFGITRLAMLKYNINDIRLLHSNKLQFLKQF